MELAQDGFLDFVCEQLAPLGEITVRKMFGGCCLYCDGIVFALIARSTLYLKADEQNRPDFERRGLEAFRPFPEPAAVMQYYLAPPELFEDPKAVLRWGGGAVAAGTRAKQKKSRPKSRTAKPRRKPAK